jgi:hypothetical protein
MHRDFCGFGQFFAAVLNQQLAPTVELELFSA